MIFDRITYQTNKEEFSEKILIYIRLVELLANREGFHIPTVSTVSQEMLTEMKDMGILENKDDLIVLHKTIGNNYQRFLSALSFFLSHKELYGNQLDKLNNKRRKELQKKEAKARKPKCGRWRFELWLHPSRI